jgi:hypothetical protein
MQSVSLSRYIRVVWSILVVELCFEYLIRPWDYNSVMTSERAYRPETARFISQFHLLFESVALAFCIPQIQCILRYRCGEPDHTRFSLQHAANAAVFGSPDFYVSRGRFVIGLQFLRMFALVRHWKQLWIRSLFDVESERANS